MVNASDDGWSGVPAYVEKAFRAFLMEGRLPPSRRVGGINITDSGSFD